MDGQNLGARLASGSTAKAIRWGPNPGRSQCDQETIHRGRVAQKTCQTPKGQHASGPDPVGSRSIGPTFLGHDIVQSRIALANCHRGTQCLCPSTKAVGPVAWTQICEWSVACTSLGPGGSVVRTCLVREFGPFGNQSRRIGVFRYCSWHPISASRTNQGLACFTPFVSQRLRQSLLFQIRSVAAGQCGWTTHPDRLRIRRLLAKRHQEFFRCVADQGLAQ